MTVTHNEKELFYRLNSSQVKFPFVSIVAVESVNI